ncbi:MAG: aminodeoxychorismate/anthranilate synthase component II [Flavobacteriia bacterium]|nr:aminodeoxychorismate/anthranilate synthase component II [Flavobacteriia bacterium]
MHVLLVDFYDSFTYNIQHYLINIGCKVDVIREDELDVSSVYDYDCVVLSPGPGLPSEKKNMFSIISLCRNSLPILGICLGMQAISEVLGGVLVNQNEVMHGRKAQVDVLKKGVLFKDLPDKINVGLYHSWKVEGLEEQFITAKSATGVIMAIESIDENLFGVQFHPESILTEHGELVLANFIQFVKNIKSV